ncbi:MAG TPA: AraC family transcriptional regulator, partial [Stellaceae bacterium]|nr:AraC family transcriptional regulator [Stellaceae bacterium]
CFVVFDVPLAAAFPDGIVARAMASPFFVIDEPLSHLARYVFSSGRLGEGVAHHATALLAHAIGRQMTPRRRRLGPIARTLAAIDERYAEALRMSELARLAGLSLSRFHERFRCETGVTPADRLAATRLDRATDLLRETRMPIAEIALAVGFSDQTALTRSFRRRRGSTPAAIRRRGAAD